MRVSQIMRQAADEDDEGVPWTVVEQQLHNLQAGILPKVMEAAKKSDHAFASLRVAGILNRVGFLCRLLGYKDMQLKINSLEHVLMGEIGAKFPHLKPTVTKY